MNADLDRAIWCDAISRHLERPTDLKLLSEEFSIPSECFGDTACTVNYDRKDDLSAPEAYTRDASVTPRLDGTHRITVRIPRRALRKNR